MLWPVILARSIACILLPTCALLQHSLLLPHLPVDIILLLLLLPVVPHLPIILLLAYVRHSPAAVFIYHAPSSHFLGGRLFYAACVREGDPCCAALYSLPPTE